MLAPINRFFVYSNIFIAICAVLMVHQTSQLLLNSRGDIRLLLFVFFSTLCSYSFHWYLSELSVIRSSRNDWLNKYRRVHIILFVIGFSGSCIFLFLLLNYWHWLLLSAVITFLYSAPKIPHPVFRALRKVALGKTIFLSMVWMYVTTILPLLIPEQPWGPDFLLFILSRFFLIYAICVLFDYRDRADDKKAGIRSLVTYLSDNNITLLFVLSLIIYAAATIGLLYYGYSMVHVVILLIPGMIVGFIYNYARKNLSDMFFYFVLDGLMALSAILMLIPGI